MSEIILGIPDFETLRTQNIVYIDKTDLIYNIIRKSGYYFFARPRRFGKTLLLSTIEKIFEGRRDLFEGLAISETNYDWVKRPVITIGLAGLKCDTPQIFEDQLNAYLLMKGRQLGVSLEHVPTPNLKLLELVNQLQAQTGQKVVLLVDEYDKPILKHLTDDGKAQEMRDSLGNFYGTIKDLQHKLYFTFLTGITKFSKTSIFSNLNNLHDLSLSEEYASLLGYTEDEVSAYFADYHTKAAKVADISKKELKEEIRQWYNGFRFSEAPITVYNPVSLMMYYAEQKFDNYWYDTGTPTFLYTLINERRVDVGDIAPVRISQRAGIKYTPGNIPLEHILFQTGYLTIANVDHERQEFLLYYPNREVRNALMQGLFETWVGISEGMSLPLINDLIDALNNNNVKLFCALFRSLMAGVPGVLHLPAEAYYHSVLLMMARLMQFRVSAEVPTNKGFIDLVIETRKHVFIFEFKYKESSKRALAQIKNREYFEAYLHGRKPITLIGLKFDDKNIVGEPIIEVVEPLIQSKRKKK